MDLGRTVFENGLIFDSGLFMGTHAQVCAFVSAPCVNLISNLPSVPSGRQAVGTALPSLHKRQIGKYAAGGHVA